MSKLKALVIDLALIVYLVLCGFFVGHTVMRSHHLLDRNGYFEPDAASQMGAGDFAYYLFFRGIERNNLGATTGYLLGKKALLPGPNNGWPVAAGEGCTLELKHDPGRGDLQIFALDGKGGRGIRLDQKELRIRIAHRDGEYELAAPAARTSNQPGWSTKFTVEHERLEGARAVDATLGPVSGAEARVTTGGGMPPIWWLLSIALTITIIWSGLGWQGLFAPPAQRMLGLTSQAEQPGDHTPRSFLLTFNGLFVVLCLLLTIAAGWFMIEVNLTNLASTVRLERMGNIFGEMFDFANVVENWKKAVDPDPATTSSWDLLEEAVPKMIETLFLAMMATVFAIPIAFVLSFLGARNLMAGSFLGMVVYTLVRMMMNIVRSVEPLAWCIIASVWVGAGTFAGVLALAVHSIAALTKLYSEQLESVEPGPIEGIRATGASGLQVLRFGVVPQIVPPFLSFTMYRWDINVRMAPILGFVGGGGIGVLLKQNFDQLDYANVGIIILLITLLVAGMDFASAHIRARLV